jgi:ribosomal protein L3
MARPASSRVKPIELVHATKAADMLMLGGGKGVQGQVHRWEVGSAKRGREKREGVWHYAWST